jgi:hypothetical protein
VIEFPTADILQLKRLDEIDWDKSQEWDMALGKPHGVVGDNGYRDINGPTPEYPEGVLTRAQEGETDVRPSIIAPLHEKLAWLARNDPNYGAATPPEPDIHIGYNSVDGIANINDLARYKDENACEAARRVAAGETALLRKAAQANRDATNPDHYKLGDIEVIQLTEKLGFCEGNVVKYVCRHKAKNGKEDLLKARWYLDRLIAQA